MQPTQIKINITEDITATIEAKNLNNIDTLEIFTQTVKANQSLHNKINNVVSEFSEPKKETVFSNSVTPCTPSNVKQFLKDTWGIGKDKKLAMFNQRFNMKLKSCSQIYYYKDKRVQ